VDVDVDVATRMEAMIADVVEILEVVGEAEDAGTQVMGRYTMAMGNSLLIP
jgi:hypothetical protein